MSNQKLPTHTTGEWMTVDGLSEYIGLSKSSIRKLSCSRRLPCYQPGKKLLFKKSEIDAWIHSSRIEAKDQTKTLFPKHKQTNNQPYEHNTH
ncbi:MAG: DNA-binding protein [Sphingobacteriales bacterium]|nr:MAG: DNA-binding protein [Sphingobacteriales bacterium]